MSANLASGKNIFKPDFKETDQTDHNHLYIFIVVYVDGWIDFVLFLLKYNRED